MSLCFTPSPCFPSASPYKSAQHLFSCIHPFFKLPANLLVRSTPLNELKQRARPQVAEAEIKGKIDNCVKLALSVDVMNGVYKVLNRLQVLAQPSFCLVRVTDRLPCHALRVTVATGVPSRRAEISLASVALSSLYVLHQDVANLPHRPPPFLSCSPCSPCSSAPHVAHIAPA